LDGKDGFPHPSNSPFPFPLPFQLSPFALAFGAPTSPLSSPSRPWRYPLCPVSVSSPSHQSFWVTPSIPLHSDFCAECFWGFSLDAFSSFGWEPPSCCFAEMRRTFDVMMPGGSHHCVYICVFVSEGSARRGPASFSAGAPPSRQPALFEFT